MIKFQWNLSENVLTPQKAKTVVHDFYGIMF